MSRVPRMIAADVVGLYTALEELGVDIWVDGGWAVDALLGEQTRPHADLDIVIQQKDLPALRHLLQVEGTERWNETTRRPGTSFWVTMRVAR